MLFTPLGPQQVQDDFYDQMAANYHLIFEDWQASIAGQGKILAKLLKPPDQLGNVLDCACGIGTQTLALALNGYKVEGSDLSLAEVKRAGREADLRGLAINFRVDDMRTLATASKGSYGAVIAFDNAIPHLDSDAEILQALQAMRRSLESGGSLLISLRDYGPLMKTQSKATEPAFFLDGKRRRIVHQVWDWQDERRYTVHLFITRQVNEPTTPWRTDHFQGNYRAVTPIEVAALATQAGFDHVQILEPSNTGFYQPIVKGIAP